MREEVVAGVSRDPFPAAPLPNFRMNPLSTRIKPNGTAWIILDMLPVGASLNDLIDPDLCTVQCASLGDLSALIYAHGETGIRPFKADIKARFIKEH